MPEPTLTPEMQYGFAGFSVLLLGFAYWLVKCLLSAFKENQDVISANTAAINLVHSTVERHEKEAARRSRESRQAFDALRDEVRQLPHGATG